MKVTTSFSTTISLLVSIAALAHANPINLGGNNGIAHQALRLRDQAIIRPGPYNTALPAEPPYTQVETSVLDQQTETGEDSVSNEESSSGEESSSIEESDSGDEPLPTDVPYSTAPIPTGAPYPTDVPAPVPTGAPVPTD
ncbi:hypothetical protein GGI12_005539, partial [Dipsacomyces acuminosporus]